MGDQERGEESSLEDTGSDEGNRERSDLDDEVEQLELSGTPVCKQKSLLNTFN